MYPKSHLLGSKKAAIFLSRDTVNLLEGRAGRLVLLNHNGQTDFCPTYEANESTAHWYLSIVFLAIL
jgi:hypothetical protein